MEEFIVKQSMVKQGFLTILSLGLTVFSAFFLYASITNGSLMPIILGAFLLLFFVFCTYHLVKLLFSGGRLVVLNKDGFYDYSSAIATKDQLIKWDEVDAIEPTNMMGKEFVSVELKNKEKVFKNQSSMTRKLTGINNKIGYKDINITMQNAKGIKTEYLAALMNEYLEKYGSPLNYEAGELKEFEEL